MRVTKPKYGYFAERGGEGGYYTYADIRVDGPVLASEEEAENWLAERDSVFAERLERKRGPHAD